VGSLRGRKGREARGKGTEPPKGKKGKGRGREKMGKKRGRRGLACS